MEVDEAKLETLDDKKHQEQLERTQKEDAKRAEEQSTVVEVHLNEIVP